MIRSAPYLGAFAYIGGMDTGILTIALGAERYGNLAAMLAATIKHRSPNVPVALVAQDSALTGLDNAHLDLFDTILDCPPEIIKTGRRGPEYCMAKCYLYDLTPFAKGTLFLDADSAWTGDTSPVDAIAELMARDFAIQCYGQREMPSGTGNAVSYKCWFQTKAMAKAAPWLRGTVPWTSTTFVWFHKSDHAAKIYNGIAKVAATPGLPIELNSYRLPDEAYYNLGICLSGERLGQNPYEPVFFRLVHGEPKPAEICKRYLAMTPTGKQVRDIINLYNRHVAAACNALGVRYIPWEDKKA